MNLQKNLKAYYHLTKPGIIRGNIITAAAGFLLASKGVVRPGLMLSMVAGLTLVIASGCVFNNYLDKTIDKKMARTNKRSLVSGAISPSNAIMFASILSFLGFIILMLCTNLIATIVAAIGFIFYVLLYTPMKPRSVHATLIGSVAGAAPIVVGYTAASGRFDLAAALLFLILVLWQMPHFYAIAMYRYYDYFGAGLPVMPVKKGMGYTKTLIVSYIILFFIACCLLFIFGYAGYLYLLVMFAICTVWFFKAMHGYKLKEDAVWGRQVFRFSLLVLLVFSIMISVNNYLV